MGRDGRPAELSLVKRDNPIHLVLFFTRGVSLRTWAMVGMLDREIGPYHRLMKMGFHVSFITHGGSYDLAYADRLRGITIRCNHQDLPLETYEAALCSVHAPTLATCHVIKTNQTNGAITALQAAVRFHKPFVARCGYPWSFNAIQEHGLDSPEAGEALQVEQRVFTAADRIVVTTPRMRADLLKRFPAMESRLAVIPNAVDTATFHPPDHDRSSHDLLFVGRIAPEKNVESLLQAIEPLNVRLTIIGEGRLRPGLYDRYGDMGGRVSWEGPVPSAHVPVHMRSVAALALPSLYEGHPKVLLEALACGTPVIGADSPGIRELINHSGGGLLTGTDPESIRGAIRRLLSDGALRERLAAAGRTYALTHYALDRVAEQEASLLRAVVQEHDRGKVIP